MSQISPYQMGSPEGGAPPKQKSKSVWIWVVVGCAGMCVVCGIVGAAVLFPAFAEARLAGKETNAFSYAKTVAVSTYMYTSDFDDRFPPIDSGEAISKRIEPYFSMAGGQIRSARSMAATKVAAASFTWNQALSGVSTKNLENLTDIWLFHTSGKPEYKRLMIGFADGRASKIQPEELEANIMPKPIFNKSKQ